MSALALAVLLSLVSALAYAGGAILQERVAVTSPDRSYAPVGRVGWWAAVCLNGLGAALHVAALAFGPLSLVQPLGALTIVFALPMAALFVGRGAGPTAWRGAVMATVGLGGLLALIGPAATDTLGGSERLMLALTTFGVVGALMVTARAAAYRLPVVRSVLLAVAAGVSFGVASVFTKTVAVDVTAHGALGGAPSLAVIAVLACGGLLLAQAAYRGAGLAAPLAVLTVVNPVVAAAIGLTLFGETFRYGLQGGLLALASGVVAAGGLVLLTLERMSRQERAALTERTVSGAGRARTVSIDGAAPTEPGVAVGVLPSGAPALGRPAAEADVPPDVPPLDASLPAPDSPRALEGLDHPAVREPALEGVPPQPPARPAGATAFTGRPARAAKGGGARGRLCGLFRS